MKQPHTSHRLRRIRDRVSELDKQWFAEHPGERVRYREYIPGEMGLPDVQVFENRDKIRRINPDVRLVEMVEVEQLAPGIRRRRPYIVIEPGKGVAS